MEKAKGVKGFTIRRVDHGSKIGHVGFMMEIFMFCTNWVDGAHICCERSNLAVNEGRYARIFEFPLAHT